MRMLPFRSAAIAITLALLLASAQACVLPSRTKYPSSSRPDQVVLTFSGDPRTRLDVSWRQLPDGTADRVEVQPSALPERAGPVDGSGQKAAAAGQAAPGAFHEAVSTIFPATCATIDSADWETVVNDPVVKRCTARVTNLSADTEYRYRPADPAHPDDPAPWHRFRTAPADASTPVTFLYLGDVQKGIEEWSMRFQGAVDRHPEARFTIQVGDLVNLGARRSEYDAVFGGAAEAFATVPFVPVLGNHEYFLGGERLFEREFALAGVGPSGPGHCRAFDFGPVLVVVLDSAADQTLAAQATWLAARLDESRAPWKVVAFHHPVWPPRSRYAGSDTRDAWMATLEGHGVDLVLSGHDHSYTRTVPLRAGNPAPDGIVYVVAVAGSKSYRQGNSPIIAKGITHTPTYQVITASPDRLVLSTRTWDGAEVDAWEKRR